MKSTDLLSRMWTKLYGERCYNFLFLYFTVLFYMEPKVFCSEEPFHIGRSGYVTDTNFFPDPCEYRVYEEMKET